MSYGDKRYVSNKRRGTDGRVELGMTLFFLVDRVRFDMSLGLRHDRLRH